jgi:type IV pilus assembly protein PilY1
MSHPNTNAKPATGPFKISAISLACLMLVSHPVAALAASIPLSQKPVGTGSMQPAPNVIITVDDSGSMAFHVDTDNTKNVPVDKQKMTLLKQSLKAQFGNGTANSGKVPDKRIRLAWQSMHNNGSAPGAESLTPGKENAMRSFEGKHRVNFNTFVDSLTAKNGTPSLKMMRQAHDYMLTPAGTDSPWADKPGTKQDTPYMACRRSYHVFMTDGAWNSQSKTDDKVALGDSKDRTLPDGTVYKANATQSRIYKDNYGDANDDNASTFSDFAFNSWATDLQGSMDNSVKPPPNQVGVEKFKTPTCNAANNCDETQAYWNPKNDPATWQHMNTYTIGFGLGAVNWSNESDTPVNWDNNNKSRDNYGGDFAEVVQGAKKWPDVKTDDGGTPEIRTIELWHGALNGRGKYYPAKTADDLTQAFAAIMDTINNDTSKPLVSIAASSSTLETGLNAFIAGYDATKWKGSLGARPINSSTGSIGTTDTWNAANVLDAIAADKLANRFVFSYNGTKGINWKIFKDLPKAQKDKLDSDSSDKVDSKGQERVDYLRGDRTKEASQSGGIFRDRGSRLGDIVNSNIWYTGKPASGYSMNGYYAFRSNANGGKGGRTPMVYVGGNDGMLHGFAASNGTELMAYIPQGIAEGDLRKLTDTNYDHQYFVDGSPFTGDAFIGSTPAWTTVLVGTLGAGGTGYFVLDVTDPANFTVANAGALVLTDTTKSSDPDLGHIISPPLVDSAVDNKSRQIVKMNGPKGGRWAVVLGNGYNSINEAPVLVIQYLDGDKEIKKLSPCDIPVSNKCSANYKGNGNGLSTPQAIDLNGDGKVDIAYAGDLKGNLWKFNLTDADDSKWGVAFSAQPFFMARPTTSTVQSITTAPYWMQHPLGGIMLAIGTGQNLTDADRSSTTTESIYALYDNSTFAVSGSAVTLKDTTVINNATSDPSLPTSLVLQSIEAVAKTKYFKSTDHPVVYTGGSPKRGWYLNWSVSGQRVLHHIGAFSGEKIFVRSTVPKTSTGAADVETCSPPTSSERGFSSVFNMFTGNPAKDPVFGLKDVTTAENEPGDGILMRTPDGKLVDVKPPSCVPGQICSPPPPPPWNPGGYTGMRANWRATQ